MRTRRLQSSSDPVPSDRHIPVLLHEVISHLAVKSDDIVVDATLGGAGHARAICDELSEEGTFVGLDLDITAIERAQKALAKVKPAVHLVEANFRNLAESLAKLGISRINKILFDLGWSSHQLSAGRGFSFLADEPLIMTYKDGGDESLTASRIVNEWQEGSLADIIFGWGEERYARRIARAIVEYRSKKKIESSRELAELIEQSVPNAYRGRIHPATRTFQALRIATNDELGALSSGLHDAFKMLEKGGRIAVISFHSLEDRIVKQLFMAWERGGVGTRVLKKPLTPTLEEITANPRSRSAKLRIFEKH